MTNKCHSVKYVTYMISSVIRLLFSKKKSVIRLLTKMDDKVNIKTKSNKKSKNENYGT